MCSNKWLCDENACVLGKSIFLLHPFSCIIFICILNAGEKYVRGFNALATSFQFALRLATISLHQFKFEEHCRTICIYSVSIDLLFYICLLIINSRCFFISSCVWGTLVTITDLMLCGVIGTLIYWLYLLNVVI